MGAAPNQMGCGGQVGTANNSFPSKTGTARAARTTNVMLTQQLQPHSKFSLSKVRPDATATVAIPPLRASGLIQLILEDGPDLLLPVRNRWSPRQYPG